MPKIDVLRDRLILALLPRDPRDRRQAWMLGDQRQGAGGLMKASPVRLILARMYERHGQTLGGA